MAIHSYLQSLRRFLHNLNGSDEINCDSPPLLNCSTNHHICVSLETNDLMCLPMEKVNNGIIDCLGAADEPIIMSKVFIPMMTVRILLLLSERADYELLV